MSWIISTRQYIPAVIGEAFGGGYFAGYISHTADGNPTHALIVAPRATGATGSGYTLLTTDLQWKTSNTTTTGTTSTFDGAANTAAMVAAGIADHPAAQFCVTRTIGGYNDWYLPSLLELNIAYQNLKPSTEENATNTGINDYSVPRRYSNFTVSSPSQTSLTVFRSPFGSERFEADLHWSSTESGSTNSYGLDFKYAVLYGIGKTNSRRVRAFRKIALPQL